MIPDIVLYGTQVHARRHFIAFAEGLKRHGIKSRFQSNNSTPDADLVVMWSHRYRDIRELQKNKNRDYLIMERGYFKDRFYYTSLGFNGLNGRAEFYNSNSPNDRFAATGFIMKPWRQNKGDYILILGQVSGDCSVSEINIKNWYLKVFKEAKENFNLPIYFRKHPKSKEKHFSRELQVLPGNLDEALKNAHCAITFNSNSGVDAIMAGIPTIAYDRGSMAWKVSTHIVSELLFYFDRYQWACNLAYCQWTMDEIKKGIAWDHLRQRYI